MRSLLLLWRENVYFQVFQIEIDDVVVEVQVGREANVVAGADADTSVWRIAQHNLRPCCLRPGREMSDEDNCEA